MKIREYALVTIALFLCACSGSVSATRSVVPAVAPAASPPPAVSLTFDLGVMKASAHPAKTDGSEAWFSPAARSVSIAYDGPTSEPTRTFGIGRGEPHCKLQTLGTLCRIILQAPKSVTHFSIQVYDGPHSPKGGVSGKLLAQAKANASRAGKLTFSVLGVWQKIAVLSLNAAPVNGSQTNLGLKLSIKDVDGYTVYGKYRGSIDVGFRSVPFTPTSSFKFLVNGKGFQSIETSSDRYSAWYSGHGVISATMVVGSTPYGWRRTSIKPVPQFVSVAASPPLGVASQIVGSSDEAMFTEPSGKVGKIAYGAFSEVGLPSGHAINRLNLISDGLSYVIAFATAQNTVGLLEPTLEESPVVSGSPIVGVDYDWNSLAPLFAQSNGAISEYLSGSSSTIKLEYQAPGTPNLTDFQFGIIGSGNDATGGWVFTDAGNGATGFLQLSSYYKTFSGSEQALPAGSGTPAFSAVSPQGVLWTAIAAQPRVVIGSNVIATAAPLTSLAVLRVMDSQYMAATDTSGNIEIFNGTGKRVATYTPPDGAASGIVWGGNDEFLYVCATCTHGLHELLY